MISTGRLGIFDPDMEKRNMLSVEDLTKTYGERMLFEGLTFGVQEGERVALVARNGSGKSTLLRAISGQEPADEGRVVFSSGVRHAHLRQDLELEAGATILDTLYIGDSPTVQAMRSYERALAEGHEGDDLQRATTRWTPTKGGTSRHGREKSWANSTCTTSNGRWAN